MAASTWKEAIAPNAMRLALRALIVIALVLDTARATNAVLLMVAAVRAAAAVSLRLSNCAGQSANLPSAECDAWVAFYDATGGNTTWNHCGGNRTDPCACSYEDKIKRGVTCSGSHITEM